jgi:hypothetical protein
MTKTLMVMALAMETVTATGMVTVTAMEIYGNGGNKGNSNGYIESNGNRDGNNDS